MIERSEPLPEKPVSTAIRFGRAVAALFLTWVALSLAFTLVPQESVLRKKLAPVFDRWRSLTGAEQHWDMFATVPHHRGYEVTVEVQPSGGGSWRVVPELGPILPGLEPMPAYFRYHTFFTRLDENAYDYSLDPYLARLGEAIVKAHPEWTGGKFRLRKAAQRIHQLETIRDLGEASYEQTILHGPVDLPK